MAKAFAAQPAVRVSGGNANAGGSSANKRIGAVAKNGSIAQQRGWRGSKSGGSVIAQQRCNINACKRQRLQRHQRRLAINISAATARVAKNAAKKPVSSIIGYPAANDVSLAAYQNRDSIAEKRAERRRRLPAAKNNEIADKQLAKKNVTAAGIGGKLLGRQNRTQHVCGDGGNRDGSINADIAKSVYRRNVGETLGLAQQHHGKRGRV